MTAPYHLITHTLMVKPKGEELFCERATEIRLSDEAAGIFVEISQPYTRDTKKSENIIGITDEEWPLLKRAVDRMFQEIQHIEREDNGEETPCQAPERHAPATPTPPIF
jgi:hypothetical protein